MSIYGFAGGTNEAACLCGCHERIRTLEAALEKWKNADLYTGDEYRTLEAAVERLREENERHTRNHADCTGHLHTCAKVNGVWQCATGCAQARVRELEAALSTSRGQWIHSVNAEQCLAALREPTLRSGRQEK